MVKERKEVPYLKDIKSFIVFGDLHADDVFEGRHKNYMQNTVDIMVQLLQITAQKKPDLVILAGDLIGVRPGRSKVKTLKYLEFLVKFIRSLGPKVIVVKGNHDYAEDSGYDFLANIGLFEAPKALDYNVDLKPTEDNKDILRLHLIDYGQEYREIETVDKKTNKKIEHNVIIAHNDFYIEDQLWRRPTDEAIELTKFSPFFGADIILSGHIHTPSPEVEQYKNLLGEPGTFINLGCPTRPSHGELYDMVWSVCFEFNEQNEWEIKPEPIKLKPYSEIFVEQNTVFTDIKNQIDKYDEERQNNLQGVLDMLLEVGPMNIDLKQQIQNIPNASEKAKEKAITLVDKALNSMSD